jgi:2-haloalkanoic acid dehalogenase type II
MPRLSDFKVLTFDCYGTLIDWETGIWDAFQPLLMANNCSSITRQIALEAFADLENAQQAATPSMIYGDLLRQVHAQFAARFDLRTNSELDGAFGDAITLWPAFPDTADALRFLKTRYKLVILSNVSHAGFAASNRKLGVTFDAVYTAEDIGSYKPSHANFEYMLQHLASDFGLDKGDILHTAQSLFHDHVPAKHFGLANAWIDRQRLSESGRWGATAKIDARPDTDFLFFSMGEMAEAVARETNE